MLLSSLMYADDRLLVHVLVDLDDIAVGEMRTTRPPAGGDSAELSTKL
jgi:hypothetical protein